MTRHAAAFSMMVNYHAIGLYFRERGGLALLPPSRDKRSRMSAFLMGAPDSEFTETRFGHSTRPSTAFGACEYCALAAAHPQRTPPRLPDVLLALFKLGSSGPLPDLSHSRGPLGGPEAKKASGPAAPGVVQAPPTSLGTIFYPMD